MQQHAWASDAMCAFSLPVNALPDRCPWLTTQEQARLLDMHLRLTACSAAAEPAELQNGWPSPRHDSLSPADTSFTPGFLQGVTYQMIMCGFACGSYIAPDCELIYTTEVQIWDIVLTDNGTYPQNQQMAALQQLSLQPQQQQAPRHAPQVQAGLQAQLLPPAPLPAQPEHVVLQPSQPQPGMLAAPLPQAAGGDVPLMPDGVHDVVQQPLPALEAPAAMLWATLQCLWCSSGLRAALTSWAASVSPGQQIFCTCPKILSSYRTYITELSCQRLSCSQSQTYSSRCILGQQITCHAIAA